MNIETLSEHPWTKPIAGSVVFHIAAAIFLIFVQMPSSDVSKEHVTPRFRVKGMSHLPQIPGPTGGGDVRLRQKGLYPAVPGAPDAKSALKDVPVRSIVGGAPSPVQRQTPQKPTPSSVAERTNMNAILAKTDERRVRDVVEAKQRVTTGGTVEKILSEGRQPDREGVLQALGRPLAGLSFRPVMGVDPEEGMPGFTPGGRGGGGGGGTGPGSPGGSPDGIEGAITESRAAITPYEALDDLLDIELTKFTDPKDGVKYFRVRIFAKPEAKRFPVMPKELIFAIDCSLSISPDRLEEFKDGVGASLKNLNEGDVFNIVAFQDKPIFFSPQPLKATPEAITKATSFVGGLASNQRTDVFGAFEAIVKSKPSRLPSNVILISDGRPTHGIVDDRELLSGISRLNGKVRPIFAFSGGRRVNRYLLDFIAYQNRAWAEYVKRTTKIADGLEQFYLKIKDPIFLNLRYELNGVDENEVFPKSLPDFYRNAEFTVYGTYAKEGPISMQLLGDINGETKQLVFTRSLVDSADGGQDVRQGYAFNKIYHLISRLNAERDNPALLQEIRTLSDRYGITTPYSPDLEKMD